MKEEILKIINEYSCATEVGVFAVLHDNFEGLAEDIYNKLNEQRTKEVQEEGAVRIKNQCGIEFIKADGEAIQEHTDDFEDEDVDLAITGGKFYKIIREMKDKILIIDDNGEVSDFSKSFFH